MKKIALISTSVFFISVASFGAPPDKTALGGSWTDANNWSPTGVPGDSQTILIPVGVTQTNYGQYIEMDNSILVVRGTLSMESSCELCPDYGQMVFTGANAGVIIQDGGQVRDDSGILGGSLEYIQAGEPAEKAWSGAPCVLDCGTEAGNYTSTGETAWPSSLQNPLPVEFLFFEAAHENGTVLLEWATATEITNQGFEVERSADGESFIRVGYVQGHGDSKERIDYNYSDGDISPGLGNSMYYRLKQVDYDGQFDYSKVVMVSMEVSQNMIQDVSPNPFESSLLVNMIAVHEEEVKVDIYDSDGKNMMSGVMPVFKGKNMLDVRHLNPIPKGIYILNISGAEFVYRQRIVK